MRNDITRRDILRSGALIGTGLVSSNMQANERTVELDPIRGISFDGMVLTADTETVAADYSGSVANSQVIEPSLLRLGESRTTIVGDGIHTYALESNDLASFGVDLSGDIAVALFASDGTFVDMASSASGGLLSAVASGSGLYFARVMGLGTGRSPYTLSMTASTTSTTKIALEAESAANGSNFAPLTVRSADSASAGEYIVVPDEERFSKTPPTNGHANYSVDLPTDDEYAVWIRGNGRSDGNSFHGRVDDRSWEEVHFEIGSWNWRRLGDKSHKNQKGGSTFSLSSGTHTVELAYREDGCRLDKVVVTNDLDYTPTGEGPATANEAPTASFTASSMTVTTGSSVEFDASGSSDSDGSISSYDWAFGDGTSGTGQIVSHAYESSGDYSVTLTVTDDGGSTATASTTVTVEAGQGPYGGTARTVTDTIEAEDFDTGGQDVAYYDTTSDNEGGHYRTDEGVDVEDRTDDYNVGYTDAGEWLEYTVDVPGDTYDVIARAASANGGGTLEVTLGDTTLGTVDIPDTGGWSNWTTVTLPDVTVPGENSQVLRLEVLDGGFNLDWITFNAVPKASFTASETTVTTGTAISFDASNSLDPDGSVSSYEWSFGDETSATGKSVSHTYEASGDYSVTLTVTDNDGSTDTSSTTITVEAGQGPYGGVARNITDTIEAEDFDTGGQDVAYHDTTSGNEGGHYRTDESVDIEDRTDDYSVGYTDAGEWLEYTVDATEGTYDLTVRVASSGGGGSLEVSLGGTSLGTVDVPDTGGWSNWTAVTLPDVDVIGGDGQILRIDVVEGGLNLDWITFNAVPKASFTASETTVTVGSSVGFDASASADPDGSIDGYDWAFGDGESGTGKTVSHTYEATGDYSVTLTITDDDGATDTASTTVTVESGSTQAPYGGVARDVTNTIEAEDFDTGGQDVAYYDTTSDNKGGFYRTDESVDIEDRTDDYTIGWTDAGEWIEYTVDVPEGTYDVTARVASESSGGSLQVDLDDTTLGTIDVPATGGWGDWTTATLSGVTVSGGTSRVLRLEVADGGFNLDWIVFQPASTDTNSAPSVSIDGPSSLTVGENGTFTASGSDPDGDSLSYEWTVDGSVIGSGTDLTTSFDTTGDYTVAVTASDGNGGSDAASTSVSVTSSTSGDYVAVNDGNWTDSNTWDVGSVPSDGATVSIQDGVTVTVASVTSARVKTVDVTGTLRFDPSTNAKLRAETVTTDVGSRFEIGTETNPIASDVTAELEFVDHGPIDESQDPDRVTKGLIVRGDLEIVGAKKKSWSTLTQAPVAGNTSITLSSVPTNWNVGDEVVVPGLEPYTSLPLSNNDEERTIAAITDSTVEFDTALKHDHVPPASDLDTYVLNLTRNVKFYSENIDIPRRGHFMVMSTETTIKYLEARDMGRTDKSRDVTSPLWGRGEADPATPPNPRARYPIHFHETGVTEPAHVVNGCVVRGSPGWGYVNHGSNAEIDDNISYQVFGSGFVAEKGTEVGTFRRNFALRSTGSGEQTETRKGWSNSFANKMKDGPHNIDDFGHSGHGIWSQSPTVAIEDNVLAGHRHTPVTYWCRALYENVLDDSEALDGKHDTFPQHELSVLNDFEKIYARPGDDCPPTGGCYHEEDASKVFTDSLPLRSFSGNVAFGCGGGFDISRVSFRNRLSELYRHTHSNNTVYNIGPLYKTDGTRHLQENFKSSGNVGLDHRYVGNIDARNYRLLGRGSGIGVYNNFSYIDDFHITDSEIANWEIGLVPAAYNRKTKSTVRNTTFENNEVDIQLPGRFGGDHGQFLADGNTYSGNTTLEWPELTPPVMLPDRIIDAHSNVTFEGRTVYHGWSDPNFVLVEEDDTERLDKIMNRAGGKWQDVLNGDDPRQVLPGTTHQELYDQYGITFYGGLLDPAEGEERSDFTGSGGTYDSTPFLGPRKSMPTDEIWIDAVNEMSFSGDWEVVQPDNNAENTEPLRLANDQSAVQLNSDERNYDLPIEDSVGVASYDFKVDKPGTYQVHTRCQQGKTTTTPLSGDQTSRFHIRIDSGSWKLHDGNSGLAGTDELDWRNEWWAEFDLSEGQHTIDIAGSGWGMRLDWVLIKHETVAANPLGKGLEHTPR